MPINWIDITPDLGGQSFCKRLFFWPCQSGLALSNACVTCDIDGMCKVFCCCPCRTACGWCATQAEKDPHPEPEEIPYNRVFEMEKKKRAKMNTSIY